MSKGSKCPKHDGPKNSQFGCLMERPVVKEFFRIYPLCPTHGGSKASKSTKRKGENLTVTKKNTRNIRKPKLFLSTTTTLLFFFLFSSVLLYRASH
jgi:hypothetical protein